MSRTVVCSCVCVIAAAIPSGVVLAEQAVDTASLYFVSGDAMETTKLVAALALSPGLEVHYQYFGTGTAGLCSDCAFEGVLGLPQGGEIVGIDVSADKDRGCYGTLQPVIMISYDDGRTYRAKAEHRECNPDCYCSSFGGWLLITDFGFGGMSTLPEPRDEGGMEPGVTLARPNPFGGSTVIEYSVPRSGATHLAVYGVDGRLTRMLLDEPQETGSYSVVWDGRDSAGRCVPAGVYVVRCQTGGIVSTDRVVITD